MSMRGTYKIRCNHCGGLFGSFENHHSNSRIISANIHIETELPIRCPLCRGRINNSLKEFIEQIETIES